jgi:hypothetical protein
MLRAMSVRCGEFAVQVTGSEKRCVKVFCEARLKWEKIKKTSFCLDEQVDV